MRKALKEQTANRTDVEKKKEKDIVCYWKKGRLREKFHLRMHLNRVGQRKGDTADLNGVCQSLS